MKKGFIYNEEIATAVAIYEENRTIPEKDRKELNDQLIKMEPTLKPLSQRKSISPEQKNQALFILKRIKKINRNRVRNRRGMKKS